MKKDILQIISVLAVSVLLMSWGNTGHRKISGNAALSFNDEMTDFHAWVNGLVEHASDADYRKQWDPDEAPRHYIDIDLYDEFIINGQIPHDMEDAISIHGHGFVYDAGILPWATLNTYDSLVRCLQRLDWDNALLYAADLGHYVADGHMPLHITANFDGQYTGNNGIHSRYESSMVNTYQSQILYEGSEISLIPDVSQYIFSYLYSNYTFVDSVLAADDYAISISGSTSSTEYKAALWQKTRGFTIRLFEQASHTLAELIYSAWAEAGKPKLFTGPFIFTHDHTVPEFLQQNFPNPFSASTTINFSVPEPSQVILEVRDIHGDLVAALLDDHVSRGEYRLDWKAYDRPGGIYLLVLKTERFTEVRKMMLLK